MYIKVAVVCGVLIQYMWIIVGRKGFKIISQSAIFLFVWEQDLALLPEVNPVLMKCLRKSTFQGSVLCLLLVFIHT